MCVFVFLQLLHSARYSTIDAAQIGLPWMKIGNYCMFASAWYRMRSIVREASDLLALVTAAAHCCFVGSLLRTYWCDHTPRHLVRPKQKGTEGDTRL